jgi:hypothetical protein
VGIVVEVVTPGNVVVVVRICVEHELTETVRRPIVRRRAEFFIVGLRCVE